MPIAHFFGYGSLVNRRTHDFDTAWPAVLPGWRRAWRATAIRPVCFLTAVPDAASEIDGLVTTVPAGGWAGLDTREQAYDRVVATTRANQSGFAALRVTVFAIGAGRHSEPGQDNPLLLSYLDTVLQGYAEEFGAPGVTRFFESTDGWDRAPVLDDRAAPRYPRHQRLGAAERDMVDAHLADFGARVVPT